MLNGFATDGRSRSTGVLLHGPCAVVWNCYSFARNIDCNIFEDCFCHMCGVDSCLSGVNLTRDLRMLGILNRSDLFDSQFQLWNWLELTSTAGLDWGRQGWSRMWKEEEIFNGWQPSILRVNDCKWQAKVKTKVNCRIVASQPSPSSLNPQK